MSGSAKGFFKQLTSQWKSLTPAQLLAWNKLALSQEGRSVLGTKAKISGSNLFTRPSSTSTSKESSTTSTSSTRKTGGTLIKSRLSTNLHKICNAMKK